MGMLVNIILLLIFALSLALCLASLRLLVEDFDAVEIELHQVEGWNAEDTQLDSE
jgi:ABC-type polysaccharide/polyol phosphate export permease